MEWDEIFALLESWREKLKEEETGKKAEDPSVSALAAERCRDPWAVLVSTILSLRTKDEVTLTASRALLGRAPAPAALWELQEEEIARLAYPAGFYRTKAANLKNIARILLDRYGGKVPADMDALLALPGVGRKTANLVLTEAFDLDGICVDVHVHRICNRAGWVSALKPEQTEESLRRDLPKKYWKRINALLVLYGQQICRPLSPFCSRCLIHHRCERRGVTRSR
ncbi:MAG: endonuclease III [Treponema sp.]|jgi:endonuclease-3|nr:endonuclease III [Treponema sp.]